MTGGSAAGMDAGSFGRIGAVDYAPAHRGIHPNGASRFVVRNREEGGTEVEISLPLRREDEGNEAHTLEPIHVLVADDEAPARQRLMDLLRRIPRCDG